MKKFNFPVEIILKIGEFESSYSLINHSLTNKEYRQVLTYELSARLHSEWTAFKHRYRRVIFLKHKNDIPEIPGKHDLYIFFTPGDFIQKAFGHGMKYPITIPYDNYHEIRKVLHRFWHNFEDIDTVIIERDDVVFFIVTMCKLTAFSLNDFRNLFKNNSIAVSLLMSIISTINYYSFIIFLIKILK